MLNIISILILLTLPLKAPNDKRLVIVQPEKIMPYEAIWNAVCKVESSNDPFAIGDKHLPKHSYGVAQIRQIRLDDYYDRTGIRYTTEEMFDPVKSKEVFIFFAHRIGPYDFERVARNWNGKWSLTEGYWRKVQKNLLSL